jgi:prepilin-type N-terminal cleavage/methylation domain-containing protein
MMYRRAGFTLLEIVMVLALSLLVLGMLYQAWVTATRYSYDLEARFTALSKMQVSLVSLTRQISQARRVLYPAPGGKEQDGFSIARGDGKVVLVRLVVRTPDRLGFLEQIDMRTGERSILMDGVLNVQCRVPAVPPGRDPDILHITLTMAGPRDQPLYVMASARLRPLDARCPISR